MRIGICDDEAAQRQLIQKYIQEWAKERRVSLETVLFASAENVLFCLEDDAVFDLLILDIEMGSVSGMELAGRLRKNGSDVPILFATGYEQYMAQGYEVSALHFLLKPIHKEKLFAVLDRLKQTKKTETKILFPIDDGTLAVYPSDIWYVEASGHQCVLVLSDRRCIIRQSFGRTQELLKERKSFVRCHRSYLVNLCHVSAIVRLELVMDDHTVIPVSRRLEKQVNEAFIRNYT